MKPLVCFITVHSPYDVNAWSGINNAIFQQMKMQFDIFPIYGLGFKHTLFLKIAYRLSRFLGKQFFYELSYPVSKQMGKELTQKIPENCQAIFTLSSHIIPYLKTDIPIFLYRDSTFRLLYDYYEFVSDLTFWDKLISNHLEKKAFKKCTRIFMASEWAAESVRKDYRCRNVSVVPFGANLPNIPTTEECQAIISSRSAQTIILIFVGKDFVRKGGGMAQNVTSTLNKRGIPTELHVFGDVPSHLKRSEVFIHYYGFTDKSNSNELNTMLDTYRKAHILLLPTQAECFGIVFSEAAAFGIPSVAFATGGVPTAIKNGDNGFCLPANAKEASFIDAILELWHNYPTNAQNARRRYEQELNWGSSIQLIASEMQLTQM
ncbi:MAG: glycosyltransferase [Bacteroidia bacterium]|nr:MAG: glycosyltransferase [Bacteroidia bacterium]